VKLCLVHYQRVRGSSSAVLVAPCALLAETLSLGVIAGQNNPLHCPYNLYAEQISGTAFTVPRK
jgi:homogentisate 1,2-dioxygenase